MAEAVTHIGEGGVVAHGPHTGAHLTGQGVAALISVHPDILSSSHSSVCILTSSHVTVSQCLLSTFQVAEKTRHRSADPVRLHPRLDALMQRYQLFSLCSRSTQMCDAVTSRQRTGWKANSYLVLIS